MAYDFYAGVIEAGKGTEEPDWAEVAERLDFVIDVYGLRMRAMRAYRESDEGKWLIPFFAARNDELTASTPDKLIEHNTPLAVKTFKLLDLRVASTDCLREMKLVTCAEPPRVKADSIRPMPKRSADANVEHLFDGLVGMEAPRGLCSKVARLVQLRGRSAVESLSMVFVGNPGTGKTELAMRLLPFYDAIGVTDGSGRFVKAGEADLVAKYVGHTAPKVRAVVESALGGMLFIDEAYAIASAPHFGQEAIDALVDQLDVHRQDLVCVIAGYPDEIDALLSMNPGLRDRFGFTVKFPDYSDDELAQIFRLFVAGKGYTLDAGAEKAADRACAKLRGGKGFSNARSVRRLADHCVLEAAWTHDEPVIYEADVRASIDASDMVAESRVVGFC